MSTIVLLLALLHMV